MFDLVSDIHRAFAHRTAGLPRRTARFAGVVDGIADDSLGNAVFALCEHVAAQVDAAAAGAGFGFVLQVAMGEAGGGEGVFVAVYRRLRAGHHPACQVGVALDTDIEPLVACPQAALLGDAGVVAVDAGFAEVDAAAGSTITKRRDAQVQADAGAALLAGVGAAVLQAFDGEVAADVGGDFCLPVAVAPLRVVSLPDFRMRVLPASRWLLP